MIFKTSFRFYSLDMKNFELWLQCTLKMSFALPFCSIMAIKTTITAQWLSIGTRYLWIYFFNHVIGCHYLVQQLRTPGASILQKCLDTEQFIHCSVQSTKQWSWGKHTSEDGSGCSAVCFLAIQQLTYRDKSHFFKRSGALGVKDLRLRSALNQ